MTSFVDLGLHDYRLFVSAAAFLAAVHAYHKLSPYFAATWFGSGLVFGYFWSAAGQPEPEVVLLPALVFYMAAATTKALVESSRALGGNHLVHVLVTGLLCGLLALPFEASARVMGWPLPRPASRVLLGVDPGWLGGVSLDAVLLWCVAGTLFYGVYKVLDHIGIGRSLQTLILFLGMPVVVSTAVRLHGLL